MTETEQYKHVFVDHSRHGDDLIEINPEYVYMMIPSDYVCIYHKLLVYLADFGKELLSDCSSACKGSNKTVVDCWNMFQSAIACRNLGRNKEAELYINYIKNQLNLIYKGSSKKVYDDKFIATLDSKGHLKGVVTCNNSIKFEVDPETGRLIELIKSNDSKKHVFVKEEGTPIHHQGYNIRAVNTSSGFLLANGAFGYRYSNTEPWDSGAAMSVEWGGYKPRIYLKSINNTTGNKFIGWYTTYIKPTNQTVLEDLDLYTTNQECVIEFEEHKENNVIYIYAVYTPIR